MSRRRNSSLREKSCCTDVLSHLLRLRFTPEELEQRDKSRKIDKFLEKDKNSFRRQVKLWTFPHSPCLHRDFPFPMNHFSVLFHIFLIIVASERARPKPRELQLFIVYIFLQESANLFRQMPSFSRWNCFCWALASRESRRSSSKCASYTG